MRARWWLNRDFFPIFCPLGKMIPNMTSAHIFANGAPWSRFTEACYCPDFQRCDAFSPDYVQQALGLFKTPQTFPFFGVVDFFYFFLGQMLKRVPFSWEKTDSQLANC